MDGLSVTNSSCDLRKAVFVLCLNAFCWSAALVLSFLGGAEDLGDNNSHIHCLSTWCFHLPAGPVGSSHRNSSPKL